MSDDIRITNTLECILFAAKEPVPVGRLAEALEQEATDIPRLLEQLDHRLAESGIQVVGLAGGYTLATRPEYAEAVQRFLEPDPEKLSVQALETLAIIAYNQPLTRPEIDEIRGVNSSGAVNSLIDKGLVRVAGRKDAPGRPFLLESTPHFLSIFGLKDLADLPAISSLRQAMEEQMAAQTAASHDTDEEGEPETGVDPQDAEDENRAEAPLAEEEPGEVQEPDQ